MSIEKDKGQCETCGKEFAYFLVHNGFNDSAYSYCNSCGRASILSGWYDKIPAVAKLKLHHAIPETTEPHLEKCEYGRSGRPSMAMRLSGGRNDFSIIFCETSTTGWTECPRYAWKSGKP